MNTVLIQAGYLLCVIFPYIRNDNVQVLREAYSKAEGAIQFTAAVELETERNFIRVLRPEMPDFERC